MGGNPVIRFPVPAADEAQDRRARGFVPETQRRIIRQPVPLPLPRSERSPSHTGRHGAGPAREEDRRDPEASWLHATPAVMPGRPCRRSQPATRGAFEIDVSSDFYPVKSNHLPPALFGYWFPRSLQIALARRRVAPPLGPEILGYDDPVNNPPPSILGYWPFHRPPPSQRG